VADRAYLRPEARRRQLLEAASRVFDRGGLGAITMSAVAEEAGASRRLVYDHFADLSELNAAFFEDRVARYAARIDAAVERSSAGGVRSFAGAIAELLAVSSDDLRALALVLADGATPSLAGARAALQEHLRSRWQPVLAEQGIAPDVAAALMWTLATSFVNLAELAHAGELSHDASQSIAVAITASLPEITDRLVERSTPRPELS
jgi:AcrR family transcriptional regulator